MNASQWSIARYVPIATAASLMLASWPAHGQVSTRSPYASRASASLGSTLRQTVGRAGFSGPGAMAASPGALGPYASQGPTPLYGSRPLARSAVYFRGTKYLGGNYQATPMISYFGRSPSAFWFAAETYTGRGMILPPIRPFFINPDSHALVEEHNRLLFNQSFEHRAFSSLEGGAIRDELTNMTLANVPELPEDLDSPDRPQISHVDMLARQLEARRVRYLAEGWAKLRQGDYMSSRQAFDIAGQMVPEDPTPRVGKLLAAAADRQFWSAQVYLGQLAQNHEQEMFSFKYRFDDIFENEQVGEALLASCAAVVKQAPQSDILAALQVYLLWLGGEESTALPAADRLRDNFRGSAFAVFADRIRQQLAASQLDAADPAGSGGPSAGSFDGE